MSIWRFRSKQDRGQEWIKALWLYPEIDGSSCVDDADDQSGEGQLAHFVARLKRRYPEQWEADAVPIFWGVQGDGVAEWAPNEPKAGSENFLDVLHSSRESVRTGEEFESGGSCQVRNTRFPLFAKALGYRRRARFSHSSPPSSRSSLIGRHKTAKPTQSAEQAKMRFLQTDSGEGLINAVHIVQIEDAKGEDASGSVAKLADGRSVSFYFNANMLEASLCPVIAAAPGFMLLQKYKNDSESRAPSRLAIVAWRIPPARHRLPCRLARDFRPYRRRRYRAARRAGDRVRQPRRSLR